MSRLPSWRSNEPPAGPPEGVRMRGPVIRPADFVQEPKSIPPEDPVPPLRKETIPVAATARVEPPPPPQPQPLETRPPDIVAPAPDVREAAAAAAPPPVVGPILDLRSATRAIWAKRLLVLAIAVVGAVLGAAVIPLLPQKFTAETSLYFDPRQVNLSDGPQASAAPELILTMIDSQTQILSSGRVLGRVVDALKLDQNSQFDGGATGETAKSIAIATLGKALLIAREASTYVVSLKVTTRDPQLSAQIANQIVTSFMEEEGKAAATAYRNSNSALDNRLNDLRQQVLEAEKAAESYRADNDMVAVEGNLMSDKRLTALNDLLVAAQQKTIEAKARADAVDKLSFEDVVSTSRPDALNSSSNSLTNLRQQYAVLAANVGSLQSQLGARHPRMLAARSSLESLAGEIRSELQRLATSAQADYEQARKAEQDIGKELSVQKALQVNTSGKLVGLNELERKATAARELYETLMKRSGQASEEQSLTQTNIRVISEAEPPLKADGPGRKVMMVAALIAGGLFGLGLGMVFAIVASLFRHPVIRGYLSR